MTLSVNGRTHQNQVNLIKPYVVSYIRLCDYYHWPVLVSFELFVFVLVFTETDALTDTKASTTDTERLKYQTTTHTNMNVRMHACACDCVWLGPAASFMRVDRCIRAEHTYTNSCGILCQQTASSPLVDYLVSIQYFLRISFVLIRSVVRCTARACVCFVFSLLFDRSLDSSRLMIIITTY